MIAALAGVLCVAGVILYLVGWWPTIREMFAENRLYGYGGFFFPIITLVFAAIHHEDLRVPLVLQLSGAALTVGGALLAHFAGA